MIIIVIPYIIAIIERWSLFHLSVQCPLKVKLSRGRIDAKQLRVDGVHRDDVLNEVILGVKGPDIRGGQTTGQNSTCDKTPLKIILHLYSYIPTIRLLFFFIEDVDGR